MCVLREPLVQFLILGGALFCAWSLFAPPAAPPRERIVVDGPVIRSLEQGFAAVWKRPPTAEERDGLIKDHIAEEVLYREAQKLGLDTDDSVIRRRMRQKMEFLLSDSLALAPPAEAELTAYFDAHAERYRDPDRVGFRQVYLGEAAGEADRAQWVALLGQLNSGSPPDPDTLGRGTLLPSRMGSASDEDIDRAFGVGFAARVKGQPPGRWFGPVESSYGWHLVLIDAIEPGAQPDFAAVRPAVERDFAYERERDAAAAMVERLKQGYDVVVGDEAK